jgi:hypothetical protein
VTDLVVEMRRHAKVGDAPSVVAFADRLEGRAAMAAGEVESALQSLERAATGFETLGVPWERALTELDLARAASRAGRSEESSDWAARAAATFAHLRDTEGAAAARALLEAG